MGSLIIDAPTKSEAHKLIDEAVEQLASSVAQLNLKDVLVRFPGCNRPYRIPVVMAAKTPQPVEGIPQLQTIYNSQFLLPPALLRQLMVLASDERPCCIVRVRDKKQIAVNQKMVDLLETPPADCVQRIMTGYWRPRDLEYVEQRYRQEGRFTWSYDAALNSQTWASLSAYFERFEVEGDWYSFNRNLYAEPIATPDDIKLPTA